MRRVQGANKPISRQILIYCFVRTSFLWQVLIKLFQIAVVLATRAREFLRIARTARPLLAGSIAERYSRNVAAGVGSAHKKRRFFLITFSLRLTPAKKKWAGSLMLPCGDDIKSGNKLLMLKLDTSSVSRQAAATSLVRGRLTISVALYLFPVFCFYLQCYA